MRIVKWPFAEKLRDASSFLAGKQRPRFFAEIGLKTSTLLRLLSLGPRHQLYRSGFSRRTGNLVLGIGEDLRQHHRRGFALGFHQFPRRDLVRNPNLGRAVLSSIMLTRESSGRDRDRLRAEKISLVSHIDGPRLLGGWILARVRFHRRLPRPLYNGSRRNKAAIVGDHKCLVIQLAAVRIGRHSLHPITRLTLNVLLAHHGHFQWMFIVANRPIIAAAGSNDWVPDAAQIDVLLCLCRCPALRRERRCAQKHRKHGNHWLWLQPHTRSLGCAFLPRNENRRLAKILRPSLHLRFFTVVLTWRRRYFSRSKPSMIVSPATSVGKVQLSRSSVRIRRNFSLARTSRSLKKTPREARKIFASTQALHPGSV